jgi:hypothetical protein
VDLEIEIDIIYATAETGIDELEAVAVFMPED